MTTPNVQVLKLAVCLFDHVTALDFQGPMEQLGALNPSNVIPTPLPPSSTPPNPAYPTPPPNPYYDGYNNTAYSPTMDLFRITHVVAPYAIQAEWLGPASSEKGVKPGTGPILVPTRTYESVKEGEQFDLILIPGGE